MSGRRNWKPWFIRVDIRLDKCSKPESEDFQERLNNFLMEDLWRDDRKYEISGYEISAAKGES